tara:strand:+ start:142 stop:918 length:777 start_codon:yes stop_codon:yes gene_type:complete
MKELTPEKIVENWSSLIQLIEDTFDGERKVKLLEMYNFFEDRMSVAPASGKEHYHNAMIGGYVEHVLHVTDCSLKIKKVWESDGAKIDFTDEEMIFAALHHDLGKVGDLEHDYYIPCESEWHRKNQGSIFVHNPKLQFMSVTDRALFLLQHFGIPMSEQEYLGLKLTDGLYEKANEGYLKTYNKDWQLRTNLPYILHQADMMATHIEYDQWMRKDEETNDELVERLSTITKNKESSPKPKQEKKDYKQVFDDLFGESE